MLILRTCDQFLNIKYSDHPGTRDLGQSLNPIKYKGETGLRERVHTRSRMILDILMAIYKAFQAGIIFKNLKLKISLIKMGTFASKPTETPRNPLILRL